MTIRSKLVLFGLLVVALPFWVDCDDKGSDVSPETGSVLHGSLVDSLSGEPMKCVEISAKELNGSDFKLFYLLDSSGAYTIDYGIGSIPPHKLYFSSADHITKEFDLPDDARRESSRDYTSYYRLNVELVADGSAAPPN